MCILIAATKVHPDILNRLGGKHKYVRDKSTPQMWIAEY